MKYMDALLRYFNGNDYTHREDVAILISEIFEADPDISLGEFKKSIRSIERDFFRINRIDRNSFSEEAYVFLNRTRKERPDKTLKFDLAKNFISRYFEVGFDNTEFIEERAAILDVFQTIEKPHQVLMNVLNRLLGKMQTSYQVDLHGAKEYSGIDIAKDLRGATLGFQIKSRNDNVSEYMIRSESSKAQDWGMNGFVLFYGRRRDKKVETSIQATYHHFKSLVDSKRMYCTIVYPELFAEFIRLYSIQV